MQGSLHHFIAKENQQACEKCLWLQVLVTDLIQAVVVILGVKLERRCFPEVLSKFMLFDLDQRRKKQQKFSHGAKIAR